MDFPATRLRRLRATPALRSLDARNPPRARKHVPIYPLFLC